MLTIWGTQSECGTQLLLAHLCYLLYLNRFWVLNSRFWYSIPDSGTKSECGTQLMLAHLCYLLYFNRFWVLNSRFWYSIPDSGTQVLNVVLNCCWHISATCYIWTDFEYSIPDSGYSVWMWYSDLNVVLNCCWQISSWSIPALIAWRCGGAICGWYHPVKRFWS